jgi:hypothetical protein
MYEIDPLTLDTTHIQLSNTKPKLYNKNYQLQEDNLIICKTEEDTDTEWCLAEINRICPEVIEITYYTTPIAQLEDYNTANKEQKIGVLKNARFRKTWYISSGKNVGKATLKAPFPKNPELR